MAWNIPLYLCQNIKKIIDRLGFDTSFVIFDTSDQKTLIKNCLKELNIDNKLFTEKSVLAEISNAKNDMLEPTQYAINTKESIEKKSLGRCTHYIKKG